MLEFGVFNGANLLYMAKLLQFLASIDYKQVFGFDSFEGLTEFSNQDDIDGKTNATKGFYKGREDLLRTMIQLHELENTVGIVKGLIEDKLKPFLEKHQHMLFSLIYIDTDLYSSTKLILDSAWERLSPGGIIAFDEGYYHAYPGEGTAAIEFLNLSRMAGKFTLHSFSYARQPMFYLVKR